MYILQKLLDVFSKEVEGCKALTELRFEKTTNSGWNVILKETAISMWIKCFTGSVKKINLDVKLVYQ